MKTLLVACCTLIALAMFLPAFLNAQGPSSDDRIEKLLGTMTLEEKIGMVNGSDFDTRAVPRLKIPALKMTDGPVGVRWGQSTAFPVSIAMAATWNPALVEKVGRAIGREARAKGRDMLLGPCVNINRVPHGGRNFESFGEDPYLAARMAVAYVTGVQSQKVLACAKHFACNNQEFERTTISARVDERTLQEIYLPAFKAAVQEAGVWSIMSAYNKLNGVYCSENPILLNDILKKDWGFKGFVVSDWGAVHSTVPTAMAGLDVEMPDSKYLGDKLLAAVRKGQVPEQAVNDKVRRILRAMAWAGLLDSSRPAVDSGLVGGAENRNIALETARESIVLLKNAGALLPLRKAGIKSVAVVGPNAAVARTGGGGSSQISPLRSVSPLEGIRAAAGTRVAVTYAMGCASEEEVIPVESSWLSSGGRNGLLGEYFSNMNLEGTPALKRVDPQVNFDWGGGSPGPHIPADTFSVRWTGTLTVPATGTYEMSLQSDDGSRLYLDGKLLLENWGDHAAETRRGAVSLNGGEAHAVRIEYYENGGGAIVRFGASTGDGAALAEAVEKARTADVVIACLGDNADVETEGMDRETIELPVAQRELLGAIMKVNPRTVVVLTTGAPVTWGDACDAVPAIVQTWFAGQEGGRALADVLFGDVVPSGKLPVTFPKEWRDSPAFPTYPGKDGVTDYAEGIFVGYRHFDSRGVAPLFPFGHGLSYTAFTYGELRVSPPAPGAEDALTVSLDVRNSGSRAGAEVVQLYVHDAASSLPRPQQELKAFRKVSLAPGETERVKFALDRTAWAMYNPNVHAWVVEPGSFEIRVGSSSRDIRSKTKVNIKRGS